jgi:hypothetical protein
MLRGQPRLVTNTYLGLWYVLTESGPSPTRAKKSSAYLPTPPSPPVQPETHMSKG